MLIPQTTVPLWLYQKGISNHTHMCINMNVSLFSVGSWHQKIKYHEKVITNLLSYLKCDGVLPTKNKNS
jgi:hypothetical protein